MNERPAHIGERVAGKRSQPGLHGVHGLDPAGKAERADLAGDHARLIGEKSAVLAHQNDHGRVIADVTRALFASLRACSVSWAISTASSLTGPPWVRKSWVQKPRFSWVHLRR